MFTRIIQAPASFRKWLFVALCICLVPVVFGQRIFDFEKLSMNDGFTSSKANAIIQDRKGFIWVGTWNGLNRFNGYSVDTYQPSYHDTTTLSNREVLALLEDHAGNIWIGTTSGLNRLNPETRELKRYGFQNRIISLYEDQRRNIWVGTWNGGLYKLDPVTGEQEHFFTTDIISDIYQDSRGMMWVASYHGFIHFDPNTAGFVRYLPNGDDPASISHSVVTQIAESADGNLWLGTWGGGLNKLIVHPNRDSLRFVKYTSGDGRNSLSSNVIYRLHYDDFGNLWAGTWDGGLNLLEAEQQHLPPEKAKFNAFTGDLSDPYGISGNNITALFVDRAGVLWVGSSQIDRAYIIKTGLSRYKTAAFSGDKYMPNSVRSFTTQDDLLWVGAQEKLMLYKHKGGQYEFVGDIDHLTYRWNHTTYNANSVLSLLYNQKGLWAGTEDAGLLFFPGNTAVAEAKPGFGFYNTQTRPALPGNKIGNLVQSAKYPGVIWIGTMQNGFAEFSYHHGQVDIEIYRHSDSVHSISNNNIRDVVEDQEGLVWIGTQNGLNRLNPEDGSIQIFKFSSQDTTSINDNVINIIHEDRSGNLWIGTNSGLNKKQVVELENGEKKTCFKRFPDLQHLDDVIITNILEDDSSHLWIGLYQGLVRFDGKHEKIVKEYFTNEYQHAIIERNAAVKDHHGNFCLGGANGFISFHPDRLLKLSRAPDVCITDLLIFNKSIHEQQPEGVKHSLETSVPYAESVELSHQANVLTFVFSAMDFKAPDKNKFAYYLEGFDTKWNEVGSRNSATYTNIGPGEYTFKVKAANSNGIWSEQPATMQITIIPPFWRTTVAYICYGLLLIGLLYMFTQYSIIKAREKRRIMIEHIQYEKEHELNELKSRFFTNITHEFRSPLSLILGPAEELLKIKELPQYARRQSEFIQVNAQRLLRLINQLMEFRKVEKEKMEVYLQMVDVKALLNDLYASFKGMADSKEIAFTISMKTPEIHAMADPEKYEKALYNLVANAFKYTEEGGKISIRAEVEDHDQWGACLCVEVEDTGIGITEEHQALVFERFFQARTNDTHNTGGIGLYLSKNFIELHNGTIELESELGKGSCFRTYIPYHQGPIESAEELDALKNKNWARLNAPAYIPDKVAVPAEFLHVQHEPGSKNVPKVLIIEDDSELNEFIVTGLSSSFHVTGTYHGREGLDMAKKLNPDIIITDIMMPQMDGIELCKELRKNIATSHIPVIFLTAKTMHEDEVEGLKTGAVDYINKPFNLVSLRLKIQNILDNRKRIHEKIRKDKLMQPGEIELSSLDEKFLKDAVEVVNSHLDDTSFDVDTFSYELGISANQVYRKIKALTGQTAKEFIRNQRLKTAASLFLQKKRSITEIIFMVGFSSPSYFTQCFKAYYGCTPKEYIEKEGVISA